MDAKLSRISHAKQEGTGPLACHAVVLPQVRLGPKAGRKLALQQLAAEAAKSKNSRALSSSAVC